VTSDRRAEDAGAQRATPALWESLASPEHADLIAMASEAKPGDVRAIARMRRTHSAPLVRAAMDLARARRTLRPKWPTLAEAMLADPPGAEMATSELAADHKARRFVEAGATEVLDLCSGIGADAMGMARAGLQVEGVDTDESRIWMAGRNCALINACAWKGVARDARSVDLRARWAHLDPSRRSREGKRSLRLRDHEPGPDFFDALASQTTGGAIKLAPGVDAAELPPGELEIISERGSLTQAVLWTGALARHPRSCTLLDRDGAVHTLAGEPIERGELTSESAGESAADADAASTIPIAPIGAWVFSVDPAPERAGLLHLVARETDLAMVHPLAGLFTGDAPAHSPWLTPFEVLERFPWGRAGEKRARAWLHANDAGPTEVICRGGLTDTNALARRLRGKGQTTYTLMIVRMGETREALITRRHLPLPRPAQAGRGPG